MNHYSNHHSSSRTYYKDLQNNSSKNLNLSKTKTRTLESYLEKFLSRTYKYLSPIFEDDDVMTNLKSETTPRFIDPEIEKQINKHSSSSIESRFTFFINLFRNNPKKSTKINANKPMNSIVNSPKRNNVRKQPLTNNFVLNKSSV
tara:strand:- start:2137 stop:2571 length:435 start_codon:yes stop_codon:yes gene_type:complete